MTQSRGRAEVSGFRWSSECSRKLTAVGDLTAYDRVPTADVEMVHYLQAVPLTANAVGIALVVLFQVPLKPIPV